MSGRYHRDNMFKKSVDIFGIMGRVGKSKAKKESSDESEAYLDITDAEAI